jgi:FKBP-type peptidyl-prolyl cis-trans isomerase FkpA
VTIEEGTEKKFDPKVIVFVILAVIYLIFYVIDLRRPSMLIDPKVDIITTDSGLKYQDLVLGDGDVIQSGNTASVHYTGWLTDETKFDSSVDRGVPFDFVVGAGAVIKGWDEGVNGMAVGGTRMLIIPSDLAYGERGAGNGLIPPDAELYFQVELVDIK